MLLLLRILLIVSSVLCLRCLIHVVNILLLRYNINLLSPVILCLIRRLLVINLLLRVIVRMLFLALLNLCSLGWSLYILNLGRRCLTNFMFTLK